MGKSFKRSVRVCLAPENVGLQQCICGSATRGFWKIRNPWLWWGTPQCGTAASEDVQVCCVSKYLDEKATHKSTLAWSNMLGLWLTTILWWVSTLVQFLAILHGMQPQGWTTPDLQCKYARSEVRRCCTFAWAWAPYHSILNEDLSQPIFECRVFLRLMSWGLNPSHGSSSSRWRASESNLSVAMWAVTLTTTVLQQVCRTTRFLPCSWEDSKTQPPRAPLGGAQERFTTSRGLFPLLTVPVALSDFYDI